jgi:hypothetical protein
MKTKLLAMMLLAGGSMFAGPRFSIGVGFGTPPAYAANIPPCPGPGYTWVDGYWTNNYGRQVWVPGFWNAPVVSFQVAPRFDNHFVARDDHRFDNHFAARDDRDNRQNFARAPQQSHANDNRFNGRDNRQVR